MKENRRGRKEKEGGKKNESLVNFINLEQMIKYFGVWEFFLLVAKRKKKNVIKIKN